MGGKYEGQDERQGRRANRARQARAENPTKAHREGPSVSIKRGRHRTPDTREKTTEKKKEKINGKNGERL